MDLHQLHHLGNTELLQLPKVAFLCSRNCPPLVARASYEWAVRQREAGACVISGFHSRMEKEVLRHLLPGTQPIIVALAKGLARQPEPELAAPLAAGRLLILTRYAESVTHPCEDSCYQRNRLMLELAEETVVGYASPGGKLEKLCLEFAGKKQIVTLQS